MAVPLPDPQLPGNPQDALQSIQRNFEAIAQTLAPPVPTGTVLPYAASTAPTGYLICDGSEVAVKDYPALDKLLGTTYGTRTNGLGGAGTSHFRLPDLRGRVVVSKGTHSTVNALGAADTTAANDRRPAHRHTGSVDSATTGISIQSGGAHDHTVNHSHTLGRANNFTRTGSSLGVTGGGNGDGNDLQTSASNPTTSWHGGHGHGVTDSGHGHGVTLGPTGSTTDSPSFIVLNHIIKA